MSDCETVEPCATGECDAVDEVQRLLPSGPMWDMGRGGNIAASFLALAAVKSCLNDAICQEQRENNPCTTDRLFDVWANIYSFPIECVERERFCDWVDIMDDRDCPVGSIAFYERVIEFVAPGKGITLEVRQPGLLAGNCQVDDPANPENNVFCISAPADCFAWEASDSDVQDGENERCYFIPEIECLRYYIFPFASLGYKTDVPNPNGSPIFGVNAENEAEKPSYFYGLDRTRCADLPG